MIQHRDPRIVYLLIGKGLITKLTDPITKLVGRNTSLLYLHKKSFLQVGGGNQTADVTYSNIFERSDATGAVQVYQHSAHIYQ
jgi:hypothetical protein